MSDDNSQEKESFKVKFDILQKELTESAKRESIYRTNTTKLEEELKKKVNELTNSINLSQNFEKDKKKLLESINELKNSKLNAETLSKELIDKLREEINNLQRISKNEKEKLEAEINELKIKLLEKTQAERDYKDRIKSLEDELSNSAKNLDGKITNFLRTSKSPQLEELVKKIKSKEKELIILSQKLVGLQSELDVANESISEQNERIKEKTQQLDELKNQLNDKDELIKNLQEENERLKKPPSFTTLNLSELSGFDASLNQSGKKGREERKNSNLIYYSEEDLENLIKKHQKEVENLKILLAEKSQDPKQVATFNEVLENMPKKNRGDLQLCLLGYSLATIILCLGLLKKVKLSLLSC